MIATGVINLAGQIIGLFGQKGAAAQAQIKATAANMQRTFTDEVNCCCIGSGQVLRACSDSPSQCSSNY